jgi:glycine/serine hydroxymethyltransferase
MTEPDMATIAGLIGRVLRAVTNADEGRAVRDEVNALCSKFTPYPSV